MQIVLNNVAETIAENPIIKLWILRALAYLGREDVIEHYIDPDRTHLGKILGLYSEELDQYYAGFDRYVDDDDDDDYEGGPKFTPYSKARLQNAEYKQKRIEILLNTARVRIAELEALDTPVEVSEPLRSNVKKLSDILGLSNCECRVLEFIATMHSCTDMEQVFRHFNQFHTSELPGALAHLLNETPDNIRQALRHDSALMQSGIVVIKRSRRDILIDKIQLFSEDFSDALTSAWSDPMEILRCIVKETPACQLNKSDYAHIDFSLSLLIPYLRNVIQAQKKGVNIFIHGKPGTGKTELTRLVAQELGYPLYEVASEDEEGNSVHGNVRLRSYRAAQQLMSKHRGILVFDEAEDIFGNDFTFNDNTALISKAWMNRTLEDNPVPCLWVANEFSHMNNAFIRRFDMVLELPVPPKEQRKHVLKNTSAGMLNDDAIELLAESEVIAPALVTRTGKVLNDIRQDIQHLDTSKAFEHLLVTTLRTQGYRPPSRDFNLNNTEHFDVNYAQTDVDLSCLLNGLKQHQQARVCCYGPPGTGKSAFALWLGKQLDMPVHLYRVSDLISPNPGNSERNIAEAFRLAELKRALLIFDEADSFLRCRQHAQQLWEITQVNEMLTCMESFKGIFIASTNLFAGLDEASLRRFDLKISFDYLNADQARSLFIQTCSDLNLGEPDVALQQSVLTLNRLTPGDFALNSRRHRFIPFQDAHDLLQALRQEHELKTPSASKIGFY